MVLEEPELFSFLKEFYYEDLRMSNTQFSTFDCISEHMKLFIELKSRHTHYDDLLIEKVKYDAHLGGAKFLGMWPIYICATPKGIWQFDLSWIKPKWEVRQMPKTTEFEDNDKIDKIVGYINIKDGAQL